MKAASMLKANIAIVRAAVSRLRQEDSCELVIDPDINRLKSHVN